MANKETKIKYVVTTVLAFTLVLLAYYFFYVQTMPTRETGGYKRLTYSVVLGKKTDVEILLVNDLRVKFLNISYISNKLTVVTPSFKRTDNLYQLFDNYCSIPMKEIIHKIIILWNNVGEPVPDNVTSSAANCIIPVIIKIMPKNNLTSRFYVYPEIETAAILSVDDDDLVTIDSLKLALKTWKQYPYLLVGYTGRAIERVGDNYVYIPSVAKKNYSLILTGNAVIHRFYLEMFSTLLPKAIVDFIIENKNCEDLSMNVLVGKYLTESGHPQPVGILIASGAKDMGNLSKSGYAGLWHRDGHAQIRSECLNLLVEAYGKLYLQFSRKRVRGKKWLRN